MEMQFRAVPAEVYRVMELNENFNFLWNPDPVSSLVGLGSSYVLEFFEFYGEKIGDYYDEFIDDPVLKDERFPVFVDQEKRHAAAHRKLNNFITKGITPPAREKYHPRVYDFMYGAYKEFAEPILAGIEKDRANGIKSEGLFFKEAVRSVAIFESEVCMTGFSFFDNLFDNGRFDIVCNMSGNLGVLYLLGYHYAEEMEHCCVSIEAFETIYEETLWTKELIDKHVNNSDLLSRQVVLATLHVARMLNQDISIEQITNSIGIQYRTNIAKKYITEGFNARDPEVLARREYLVNRWDNEWEPKLLEMIKQKIKVG
ncbi:putative metal-dependent hydrolase [Serratia fonticola]|uniref:Putative metal-dependent hydrolase n=1 Tax=Serratia fonticola TaxID=47917 RepID=A0A542BPR4_SERFO|nr:metal-dependent hydrolase [Serratia fonticola]TQI80561.1 putative metal-dependent hydrolase [Serratia fonticola]TQI97414.1 putative metal-dependent hydrolase [Serratia fonticola]TVZ71910.1 putative metal-dependent hydrolase [Serratia fonticola]